MVAVGGMTVGVGVAVGGWVPDGAVVGVSTTVSCVVRVKTAAVCSMAAVSVWDVLPDNCGLTYTKNIIRTTMRQTINMPNSARMI